MPLMHIVTESNSTTPRVYATTQSLWLTVSLREFQWGMKMRECHTSSYWSSSLLVRSLPCREEGDFSCSCSIEWNVHW